MKINRTFTIDIDILIQLQKRKINKSDLINKLLKSYLNVKEQESNVSNLGQVEEELILAMAKLESLQQKKKQFEKEGQVYIQ